MAHFPRANPGIPIYKNDGVGRDTYISFNNGGFSQYKCSDTFMRERTRSLIHLYHPDLALCKPSAKYIMNGTGRDQYIYHGMLDEHDRCGSSVKFPNILRTYQSIRDPIKISRSISQSNFEKNLINRIFYGKCPGLDTRYMCPKVKFTKESQKDNKDIIKIIENKNLTDSNSSKMSSNTRSRELSHTNICNTVIDDKENKLTNIERIKKAEKILKKPKIINKNDLVNSVRKIFMYNNRTSNKETFPKINFNSTIGNPSRVISENSFA